MEVGFSYKMSLETGQFGMLGVDSQHASRRRFEPGADSGILELERGSRIQSSRSGRCVRLVEPDAAPAALPGVETAQPWTSSVLSGETDRIEPSADHASDRDVYGR